MKSEESPDRRRAILTQRDRKGTSLAGRSLAMGRPPGSVRRGATLGLP
jgi:hypothetical protein